MDDAVSALNGREASGHGVTIRDAGRIGMLTLRGDAEVIGIAAEALGLSRPDVTGLVGDLTNGIAWMSPDEALLFCAADQTGALASRLSARLTGRHFQVAEVTDARAVLHVVGAGAREAVQKLTPADLHPEGLRPGQMRRTHLGQVAAAIWLTSDEGLAVICFRSVADYVFGLLDASAQGGPVGHFPT